MKWTFVKSAVCLSLLATCLPAFATALDARWFATAGAGAQFTQYNGSTTVNNNSGFAYPFNQDIYTTRKYNQPFVMLAAGQQYTRDNPIIPAVSLGLEYQYSLTSNIGGEVIQFSDPDFRNYTYHWNLNSNLLLANAKVNLFKCNRFSPYLNAGVGGSLNVTGDYTENALAGVTAPRESPDWGRNWDLEFAYQVGLGIDYTLSQQIILTLGYLYQNLGDIQSDKGAGSWSGQTLDLGQLTANSVFLSMTYLFNQG